MNSAKRAFHKGPTAPTGRMRTIRIIFDFGDGWDHRIWTERVNEAAQGVVDPRPLKATGACPPGGVGGDPGYEEFGEDRADPDHKLACGVIP